MLDLKQIQEQAEMARKDLLEKHKHKIWQGSNGQWYTYLSIDGKLVQRRRSSKKEIEDVVVAYIKDQTENPTVKDVFYAWNDWKLEYGKICDSTHSRNICVFERFYREFGKRKIKAVLPEEVRDFLEAQIPKFKLTAKAFSNLKSITRGFLKFAKRNGLITWNYDYMLSDVEVSDRDFAKRRREDYEEVYSDEEAELIVSYLMSHQDQKNLGLLLLFVTGIRIGELTTLKPENIDDDCIYIRRTETRYKKDGHAYCEVKEFPKSEAGWRTVVVPSDWQWLLEKIRGFNAPGEYCFMRTEGSYAGRRIEATSMEKRLHKVNDLLGIYHKSPHKIRKTYGTILMDQGLDQNLIIQQMGHTSILMSEQHYHRNRKSIDRKRRLLDDVSDFRYSM